jgi:hypothetical protein
MPRSAKPSAAQSGAEPMAEAFAHVAANPKIPTKYRVPIPPLYRLEHLGGDFPGTKLSREESN